MTSIRRIGAVTPAATPLPETMDVAEAAKRLGLHPDTVRRGIREDMAHGTQRIPGGYHIGGRYYVIRAQFERAMTRGDLPERPPAAPQGLDVATFAAALRTLADELTA